MYDDFNEINFNDLPDKFAMKYNHGSGIKIICEYEVKFNIENVKNKLNILKGLNYGLYTTEFQYMFINHKIL